MKELLCANFYFRFLYNLSTFLKLDHVVVVFTVAVIVTITITIIIGRFNLMWPFVISRTKTAECEKCQK